MGGEQGLSEVDIEFDNTGFPKHPKPPVRVVLPEALLKEMDLLLDEVSQE